MDKAKAAWEKALELIDEEADKKMPHLRTAIENKLNSIHPPSTENSESE